MYHIYVNTCIHSQPGGETWPVPETVLCRLEVTICKLSIMDRVPNEQILKMCNTSFASDIVRYRRLRLLGHVARMDDDALPKIMMFSTLEGVGRKGRPVKCGLTMSGKTLTVLDYL